MYVTVRKKRQKKIYIKKLVCVLHWVIVALWDNVHHSQLTSTVRLCLLTLVVLFTSRM